MAVFERFISQYSFVSLYKSSAAALTAFAESAFERNKLPAEYIITEVLFGYILQLPHPQQVVIYYSSVFIELCKSNPAVYPQIVSSLSLSLSLSLSTNPTEMATKIYVAYLD